MARNPSTKTEIKVRIDIRSGKATPRMKSQWHKFWMRLAAECQRELKAENEAKDEQ